MKHQIALIALVGIKDVSLDHSWGEKGCITLIVLSCGIPTLCQIVQLERHLREAQRAKGPFNSSLLSGVAYQDKHLLYCFVLFLPSARSCSWSGTCGRPRGPRAPSTLPCSTSAPACARPTRNSSWNAQQHRHHQQAPQHQQQQYQQQQQEAGYPAVAPAAGWGTPEAYEEALQGLWRIHYKHIEELRAAIRRLAALEAKGRSQTPGTAGTAGTHSGTAGTAGTAGTRAGAGAGAVSGVGIGSANSGMGRVGAVCRGPAAPEGQLACSRSQSLPLGLASVLRLWEGWQLPEGRCLLWESMPEG